MSINKILVLLLLVFISCGNPHLVQKNTIIHIDDFQEIVYDFESDIGINIGIVEHTFVYINDNELFFDDNGVLVINKKVWDTLNNIVKIIEVYRVLADGYLHRPETEIATMPGKISCPRSLMHPKMLLFTQCFIKHKGYYIDELKYGEDLSDLK